MRRREFITLLGGATFSLQMPFAARAQKPVPRIGLLGRTSPPATSLAAFRQSLSGVGYADGKTVAIEYRWAEDNNERLPTLATDLIRRQVAVLVVAGNPAALAAKAATNTIPIVFGTTADPVSSGLVASLNRPEGNVTGATFFLGS